MNTEVGRNLLWNETKVCSLRGREGGRKRERGKKEWGNLRARGFLSVGISILWPSAQSACTQWYSCAMFHTPCQGGAFAEDFISLIFFAVRLLAVRAATCFISRPGLVDKEKAARAERRDPSRFISAALCARRPLQFRVGSGRAPDIDPPAPQLLPSTSRRRRRRKVGHLFFGLSKPRIRSNYLIPL